MKVAPFHARLSNVHHNNDRCTEGNNIERWNRLPGNGGKPLCHNCARL